jgi:hypothetical protein
MFETAEWRNQNHNCKPNLLEKANFQNPTVQPYIQMQKNNHINIFTDLSREVKLE